MKPRFYKNPWFNDLPDVTLETCEENISLFFSTMHERQLIWKRRFIDKLPRPWTEDPILGVGKFTNVYRELDRNSQWLISHVILDSGLSLKNKVWKILVYRAFNNYNTFEFDPKGKNIQENLVLMGGELRKPIDLIPASKWRNGIPDWEEYNEDEFARFIAGVRATGQNPFTNAYLVNSGRAGRDETYVHSVIPFMHGIVDEVMKKAHTTPEELIALLRTIPSMGSFMTHEFYQDFTYIPRYTGEKFMDFGQDDFTNVGPGADVGIRLTFPSAESPEERKQCIYRLRDMAEAELTKISEQKGENFPYLYWDRKNRKYYVTDKCNITLHQIEMWLCEFQKYWKMHVGKGKQRSVFIQKSTGFFLDA